MGHSRPMLNGRDSGKCTQLDSKYANTITTHITNAFLLQTSQAISVQSRSYENYLIVNYMQKKNAILTIEQQNYLRLIILMD